MICYLETVLQASEKISCSLGSQNVKYTARLSEFAFQIIGFRERSFYLVLTPLMIFPALCHVLRVTGEQFAV